MFCISCFAFLASVFGRLVALSLFVRVAFVPVRSIAWFGLVCSDSVRLHLGCSPHAWVLRLSLCFIVYLVSSRSFMWLFLFCFLGHFSLSLALRPGLVGFLIMPILLFARAFGARAYCPRFLLPSHTSLAPFHSCIVCCVGTPLCPARQFSLLPVCCKLFYAIGSFLDLLLRKGDD